MYQPQPKGAGGGHQHQHSQQPAPQQFQHRPIHPQHQSLQHHHQMLQQHQLQQPQQLQQQPRAVYQLPPNQAPAAPSNPAPSSSSSSQSQATHHQSQSQSQPPQNHHGGPNYDYGGASNSPYTRPALLPPNHNMNHAPQNHPHALTQHVQIPASSAVSAAVRQGQGAPAQHLAHPSTIANGQYVGGGHDARMMVNQQQQQRQQQQQQQQQINARVDHSMSSTSSSSTQLAPSHGIGSNVASTSSSHYPGNATQHIQSTAAIPQQPRNLSSRPLSPVDVHYVDNGYQFDRDGRIVGAEARSASATEQRQHGGGGPSMQQQQQPQPLQRPGPAQPHPMQQQRSSPAMAHAMPTMRGGPAHGQQPRSTGAPPQQQHLQTMQQQQHHNAPAQPRSNPDDPRSIFHSYILDYLQKSGLETTAHSLLCDVPETPCHPLAPGQVHPASSKGKGRMYEPDPAVQLPQAQVQIESPSGFLFEWWSIFYEIFRQRSGPNGALSTQSLISMSHQAIETGLRSRPPMRGSTPLGGMRPQSPLTRPNEGGPHHHPQQQNSAIYNGGQPPHDAYSSENGPTSAQQSRMVNGPPPSNYATQQQQQQQQQQQAPHQQLGPAPYRGGTGAGGGGSRISTPNQQHAQIPGSQQQQVQGQGPIQQPTPRQMPMRSATMPPSPMYASAQPPGGPNGFMNNQVSGQTQAQAQAQMQLQVQRQHQQGQRHDPQQQALQAQASAAAHGVAQQALMNANRAVQGQQQASYTAQHAQTQQNTQRQLGVGARPGGVSPAPPHPSVSSALEAEDQNLQARHSITQAAHHQQQMMLANRVPPSGHSVNGYAANSVAGAYTSQNFPPASPVKRFQMLNGNVSETRQQQSVAANTPSPHTNGQLNYASPTRLDQMPNGNYLPIGMAQATDLASPYTGNDTNEVMHSRVTSFQPTTGGGSNAGSPANHMNSNGYAMSMTPQQGNTGSTHSSSAAQTPIDPVIALQQEINRSQQQTNQLVGVMAAPPARGAPTPGAGGPKTPGATPNASGLTAPETPSQFATNLPGNLRAPTPQNSNAISPAATTATTPTGPKQNNTTAAKRKREAAKEATATSKKQRATSTAASRGATNVTGPKEPKRSVSVASITTPTATSLPPTPSAALVDSDTPLPDSANSATSGMTGTTSVFSNPTSDSANTVATSPDTTNSAFFDPSSLDASDPISKLNTTMTTSFYSPEENEDDLAAKSAGGDGGATMTSDEIDALFATSTTALTGSAVPDSGHFVDYASLFSGPTFEGFESFDLTV